MQPIRVFLNIHVRKLKMNPTITRKELCEMLKVHDNTLRRREASWGFDKCKIHFLIRPIVYNRAKILIAISKMGKHIKADWL